MNREWKDILVDEYREKATKYGICNQALFDRALRMCNTKPATINLYKRCIDWCLEAGYPDLDYLRREYKSDEMEYIGLFIDHTFKGELLDKHQVYIFHNCKGRILTALNYDAEIIPMLYFANGCDMTIDCDQHNVLPIRVPLYIFGENNIKAESPNANFIFYKHDTL